MAHGAAHGALEWKWCGRAQAAAMPGLISSALPEKHTLGPESQAQDKPASYRVTTEPAPVTPGKETVDDAVSGYFQA